MSSAALWNHSFVLECSEFQLLFRRSNDLIEQTVFIFSRKMRLTRTVDGAAGTRSSCGVDHLNFRCLSEKHCSLRLKAWLRKRYVVVRIYVSWASHLALGTGGATENWPLNNWLASLLWLVLRRQRDSIAILFLTILHTIQFSAKQLVALGPKCSKVRCWLALVRLPP